VYMGTGVVWENPTCRLPILNPMWEPTCQHCRDLCHKCYGIADRVCGQCQCNKKTCQGVMVRVSHSASLSCYYADTTTVDSGPVAPCWIQQTVAPVRPPTQSKRVATKGKAASHPVMQPWARKVTQIASPTPEIVAPTTPVAGLS